jgi:ribosomal protein L22
MWQCAHDFGQSGLKLTKAYTYLGNVNAHKECIPYRRFAGGVGRTGQAKQFKATQGQHELVVLSSLRTQCIAL